MRWLPFLAHLILVVAAAAAAAEDGTSAPKPPIDHGPLVESLDAWTFWPAISSNDRLVFVTMYSDDCRWCSREAPIWAQLASEVSYLAPSLIIARVNCHTNEGLCDRLGVGRTPSYMLFRGGKEVMEYKAQIIHIHMLKPFILKMHAQLLGGQEEQADTLGQKPA